MSSGTLTSMEREPVSPLIMAVLSFKRKDNGVSSLAHTAGRKVLSFTDQIGGGSPGTLWGLPSFL